jgi:hypothetical protein
MKLAPLLDPLLNALLRRRRRRRAEGILLVSSRGPAEMVFLSEIGRASCRERVSHQV